MPLIRINNLKAEFRYPGGSFQAVRGVSFDIGRGETVCLVGESGCGKSMTALSVMRLFRNDGAKGGARGGAPLVSGEILFDGVNLLDLSEKEMRGLRGRRISMIYQEPMTSLNPVFSVGWQISEAIRLHEKIKPSAAKARALEMLRLVEIPDAEKRFYAYPHMLSGGMRQRAMIAMALCCNPDLLIADEPTTALDVTIQAQILELIGRLKKDLGMSVLFITHDMRVVAEIADRVLVMYAGHIVEESLRGALFEHPRHPYSKGLLACIPGMDGRRGRLPVIEGAVPGPEDLTAGCAFGPRCPERGERCGAEIPLLVRGEGNGSCACFAAGEAG